jgi:hypothetical protein
LITGYRADLRYRVVKRLEELESQSRPAMLSGPQFMAAALIEADIIPLTVSNRLSRCRAARLHPCEKQHKNILRDIENMIQDIAGSRFGLSDFEATYIDSRGKSQREIRLPKDLTVTLITGYPTGLAEQ